ncbi:AraC family transcriptional regulator [Nordella sp. HKS 07]|uniref:AraC family transcriptional regulator n=1 Tax=Nordella sp. HKS 07 TaxID=2712222 RepID=UPI0013E16FD1|nr:AraC family transcriptional regulator [Nordella sp. HKS 07]QIG51382.1 AraC family transcriptional regulator [Nordella sp. HKS 07]
MARTVREAGKARLERSCGSHAGDWIEHAPASAGIERIEAFFTGHAYDPHRHDTYALGYTVSGVQSFTYRGARADSLAGNAIVLHPDEVHDGRAGVEAGFLYRMIYIEPRLISAALSGRTNALPFLKQAVSSDRRLLAALGEALADLDRAFEPLEEDRIVASIADALFVLDRSLPERRISITSARAVDRAREYVDAHFARVVASEELEAVTDLDRYALARHFRARLGTSPYRYLTMRRLDQAKAAILAGQSLAEASFLSGFADQSHMTRQFKRAFGLTPGHWQALRN